MHFGCGNGSEEGRGSVVSASIEDREGEVSGISVVADMHEAQRRSALEDESAAPGIRASGSCATTCART
jgi:hypothetical protein